MREQIKVGNWFLVIEDGKVGCYDESISSSKSEIPKYRSVSSALPVKVSDVSVVKVKEGRYGFSVLLSVCVGVTLLIVLPILFPIGVVGFLCALALMDDPRNKKKGV